MLEMEQALGLKNPLLQNLLIIELISVSLITLYFAATSGFRQVASREKKEKKGNFRFFFGAFA